MALPRQLTFVDAAGIVAVLDRTSPGHQVVAGVWRLELEAGSVLVSTDYTIVQAALLLQERHGLAGVEHLFREVVPALRVERCTQADVDVAVAALLSSADAGRDLVHHVEQRVRQRLRVLASLLDG